MPVILALALAFTAAILGIRMTAVTQALLDRVEIHTNFDQSNANTQVYFQQALEALATDNQRQTIAYLRSNGWQVETSGNFFNPVLWLEWNDEQRHRFTRGLLGDPNGEEWLKSLKNLGKCFPEKSSERLAMYDYCTEQSLPQGIALFPVSTPLNINEASIRELKHIVPEVTNNQWDSFERERQQSFFSSINDFNERVPEVANLSPLIGGFDIKSRYLWLRFRTSDCVIVWLVDSQGIGNHMRILFSREG